MLVFGVDIPLVELLLVFAIITIILLIEAIILVGLFMKQMNKAHKLSEMLRTLAETLLELKNRESKSDRVKKH